MYVHRLAAADALALHLPLDAILIGGIDVDSQHIGLIFQHKVRRAAYADIAFLVQQFPQDLGLVVEEVLVADEVAALRRDEAAVVDMLRYAVEQRFLGILIGGGKNFLVDAACPAAARRNSFRSYRSMSKSCASFLPM